MQIKEDAKDIKVGTVIALMVGEGEDWKSVEGSSGAPSSAALPSEPAPGTGSGSNWLISYFIACFISLNSLIF